ncbi:hypothetical protein STEG23_019127, partial [Scotinomys teguina]
MQRQEELVHLKGGEDTVDSAHRRKWRKQRMELQTLQEALKVEIQVHQKLVAQMKQDPQNADLKKQLHELQAKITALSEKQEVNHFSSTRPSGVSHRAFSCREQGHWKAAGSVSLCGKSMDVPFALSVGRTRQG